MTTLTFGKWRGISRIADSGGRFKMLAVDQRPPLEKLAAAAKPGAGARDIAAIKRAIAAELSPAASAVLMDPLHALPAGALLLPKQCGLIVTLEDHRFKDGKDGRVTSAIPNWSVEKIKRMGGDAVKILVWHHPRAAKNVCDKQRDFVRNAAKECKRLDIPLILELLLYPLGGDAGYAESPQKKPALVLQSVRDFAAPEFGVDIFKLESPLPSSSLPEANGKGARAAQKWFDKISAAAARPWVLLSAGAGARDFARAAHFASRAGANGYLAGRAIWMEAAKQFPDLRAVRRELRRGALPYMEELNRITDACAEPWRAKPSGVSGMNRNYKDFGGAR